MDAVNFLRKKYFVTPDKMLGEVKDNFNAYEVIELLREYSELEQKLNLPGIVRPEGVRPSDEEIIHALDLAQCEIKAMYQKTGYITSTALATVNQVLDSLKAASVGGELLQGEASGTVAEGPDFFCIHSDPADICKTYCGHFHCLPAVRKSSEGQP